jgi:hypothetical protein
MAFITRTTPPYAPTTVLASGVIAAYPVTLLGLTAYNTSAAARYLQLFDAIAVPADGVVPTGGHPILIPAGGSASLTPAGGRQFSAGLSWCTSTTAATKNLGAAEMWITAEYRTLGGVTT